eukprot:403362169
MITVNIQDAEPVVVEEIEDIRIMPRNLNQNYFKNDMAYEKERMRLGTPTPQDNFQNLNSSQNNGSFQKNIKQYSFVEAEAENTNNPKYSSQTVTQFNQTKYKKNKVITESQIQQLNQSKPLIKKIETSDKLLDIKNSYKFKEIKRRAQVDSSKIISFERPRKPRLFDKQLTICGACIGRCHRRFLCRERSSMKERWDLFIMILATWNVYLLPVEVAFEPEEFKGVTLTIINNIVDFCFFLDIIVVFRTTFSDLQSGEEVTDSKRLAKNYLKDRFWIDFLAMIPLDYITSVFLDKNLSKKFLLFGLLKLVRVLRLNRIITYMNVKQDTKMTLKLIKLIFFLLMYIHLTGCAWFYLVNYQQTWVPPADYIFNDTLLYKQDVRFQYWLSFYTSAQYLTSNDQSPHSNWEIIFGVFACALGAILNANLFGQLAVIVQNLNMRQNQFQQKLDSANTAMKNLKLPKDIQNQVVKFIKTTQSSLDQQKELDLFLSMISPSLRKEVIKFIFDVILRENDLFKKLSKSRIQNSLGKIVSQLQTLLFLPEDQIIAQGDDSLYLFFLSRGNVQVSVRNHRQKEVISNNLQAGAMFGEIGLIYNCQRTASVRSKNYCIIETLHKEHFQNIKTFRNKSLYKQFMFSTYNYQDTYTIFLKNLMSKVVDYLKDLENKPMTEIIFHIQQQYYPKDSIIVNQGDILEHIYIIIEGEVDVFIVSGFENICLENLYKFCQFGSYTSLMPENKNLSTCKISARTDTQILMLKISHLTALRSRYKQVEQILSNTEKFLLDDGLPLCDFKIYRRSQTRTTKSIFKSAVRRIIKLNQRNIQERKGGALKGLIFSMQEKQIIDKINNEEASEAIRNEDSVKIYTNINLKRDRQNKQIDSSIWIEIPTNL